MAPRSSHDVCKNKRGKFDCQKSIGSVVVNVPSGFSFVISGASVASTGMGRLLAEGLRQNEYLCWITRADFEDRFDNPPQSALSHTPSHYAGRGDRSAYRLSPYDEPHPYSLHGSRDIESTRRLSLCDSPLCYSSYQERAKRGSLAYGQLPLNDHPEPLHTIQGSYDSLPPPYSSHESLPPYTSISRNQDENEIENMVQGPEAVMTTTIGQDGGCRCHDAPRERAGGQLANLNEVEEDGSNLWRSDYTNLLRGWPHL